LGHRGVAAGRRATSRTPAAADAGAAVRAVRRHGLGRGAVRLAPPLVVAASYRFLLHNQLGHDRWERGDSGTGGTPTPTKGRCMPCLRSTGLLRPMAGLILAGALGAACAGGGSSEGGTGGSEGNASGGSGGTASSTGGHSSGGSASTGGTVGTGGSTGAGGITATGGRGAGGSGRGGDGSGGVTSSGGVGGAAARGGMTGGGGRGTGGVSATGGASAPGGSMSSGVCGGGTAQSADITINEASLQQQITGFGVSSAWAGSYANASDPEYLWSTTTGAGLSLLRIRYGDGLAIAQAAAKAGVTVWMTPWGTGTNGSPGGAYTTTQANANGCKTSVPVLTNPAEWAKTLATYVQT